MSVISAVLYFFSHHSMLSMPLIWGGCALLALLLIRLTKQMVWGGLIIVGFVFGMLNPFFGSGINASFVNAFGTYGTAMITSSEVTNSQLNNRNVIAYKGVMKTADGRDVKIEFDTMSAPLYPWRNAIQIPPLGEEFVVKYIPGHERNMAIMRDESPYGMRLLMREARKPIEQAKAQLMASPGNKQFQQEYVDAVREFLNVYGYQLDANEASELKESITQPMNMVGMELAQNSQSTEDAIQAFLARHGNTLAPRVKDQLQRAVGRAYDRQARKLLHLPAGDEFYEQFILLIESHGDDLGPTVVTSLLQHARGTVHQAQALAYKNPGNKNFQHELLNAIEKYIKQYENFDQQYVSLLKKEAVRIKTTLAQG